MLKKWIRIIVNGSNAKGVLTVDQNEVTLEYNTDCITKKGDYPFMILKAIREELDKKNIFLVINGSRRDVYPSGMSLVGEKAYVQTLGKPTSLDDLVDIFDETDRIELIGTVEEQQKYHEAWITSLNIQTHR